MFNKLLLIKCPTTVWGSRLSVRAGISEEVPIPLGLCYLAGSLVPSGFQVEIFDPHLDVYERYLTTRDSELIKEAIRNRLSRGGFDLVGISSQFIYAYKWAHFIAKCVKENAPTVPVVIGGGHPSVILDETMADKNIDYLIIGEGEVSFLQLLDALNGVASIQLADIDGIIYRNQGRIIHRPIGKYIDNLDEIPFPAWDLIDVEKYMRTYAEASSQRKRTLTMITSRGCPFECTFCNVFESWGKRFRRRSPANILSEIDLLVQRYGVEEICFVDDNMTIDKRRMMQICAGLKGRDITWRVVNVASFCTNEDMLRAMKESGCTKVSISVESGSERVLKAMKKPVNLKWSEEIVKVCRTVGMPVTVNFVSGLPYETKDDIKLTFDWAARAQADWSTFSVLVPYPGTEIFEYCKMNGYLDPDSLQLESLTQRNPTIETEAWTREWVASETYHQNILLNFFGNYNLHHKDGNLGFVTGFLENIVLHHSRHVVALITLGYAYERGGKSELSREMYVRAEKLLADEEVIGTFGKYLDMDQSVPNAFRQWMDFRKQEISSLV